MKGLISVAYMYRGEQLSTYDRIKLPKLRLDTAEICTSAYLCKKSIMTIDFHTKKVICFHLGHYEGYITCVKRFAEVHAPPTSLQHRSQSSLSTSHEHSTKPYLRQTDVEHCPE